jgi:hypothetical protein
MQHRWQHIRSEHMPTHITPAHFAVGASMHDHRLRSTRSHTGVLNRATCLGVIGREFGAGGR